MRPYPHLDGVTHDYVDVNGVRLHVAIAGPEDGEPVVLQHGWPQHWYCWRSVIPRLADRGFRVYAPDLRGLGWSDAPAGAYRKSEFAADIAGVMDHYDLKDVRLAGHDWGGYATFLVGRDHPERLRSLTVFAINVPWVFNVPSPRSILAILGYQPIISTPVLGPLVLRRTPFVSLMYSISGGRRVWSTEERAAFTAQFKERDRAQASSMIYRTFLTREVREKKPDRRLTVPTTLTLGKDDPVCSPGLVKGAEKTADDLTIEVIDGGHFLPEERPEFVADKIAAS